jgi:hypothetical protein
MPTITVELEDSDLGLIRRALEKELMFIDWLLKRTIADPRPTSAAELSIELSDLRRLREALEPSILKQVRGRERRLKAGGV